MKLSLPKAIKTIGIATTLALFGINLDGHVNQPTSQEIVEAQENPLQFGWGSSDGQQLILVPNETELTAEMAFTNQTTETSAYRVDINEAIGLKAIKCMPTDCYNFLLFEVPYTGVLDVSYFNVEPGQTITHSFTIETDPDQSGKTSLGVLVKPVEGSEEYTQQIIAQEGHYGFAVYLPSIQN